MKKYSITDYFYLDSSFPVIYLLSSPGESRVALRISELESLDSDIECYRDMLEEAGMVMDAVCTKSYNIHRWVKGMDINGINSLVERTLAYYLDESRRYCCKANKQCIDRYIGNYLHELKNMISVEDVVYGQFKVDDNNIKTFISENAKDYKKEPEVLISNLALAVMQMDGVEEEVKNLIELIELKNYGEALIKAGSIQEGIVIFENTVTNYIVDYNRNDVLNISKHYRIMPSLNTYMKPIRTYLEVLDYIDNNENYQLYPMSVLLIITDCVELVKKINTVKFVVCLLCICKSPEYNRKWKEYAWKLIEVCQDIFYQGTLQKVFVQINPMNGESEERGSSAYTTRMIFVFTLENRDVYSLRLDMPHKGCDMLHLNMEETYNGSLAASAFPIRFESDEFTQVLNHYSYDERAKFMWSINDRLWFKTGFKHILELERLERKDNEYAKDIEIMFDKQSHKKLDFDGLEENDFIMFLDELRAYMSEFRMENILQYGSGKNDEDVYRVIEKIRKNDVICKRYIDNTQAKCSIRKLCWKVYNDCLKEKISEEEFLNLDFGRCVNMIFEMSCF